MDFSIGDRLTIRQARVSTGQRRQTTEITFADAHGSALRLEMETIFRDDVSNIGVMAQNNSHIVRPLSTKSNAIEGFADAVRMP